jgi:small GTP-binding protein
MSLKVVLLGDTYVGKTSLVSRWTENKFQDNHEMTIGSGLKKQTFELRGETHELHIWDTAGQEKYQSMVPIYSKNAAGALLVFSLTSRESLEHLREWRGCLESSVQFIIVGNKVDLVDTRQVTFDEAVAFAQEMNAEYFETSAKSGCAVTAAFEGIAEAVVNAKRNIKQEQRGVDIESQPDSSCCCSRRN